MAVPATMWTWTWHPSGAGRAGSGDQQISHASAADVVGGEGTLLIVAGQHRTWPCLRRCGRGRGTQAGRVQARRHAARRRACSWLHVIYAPALPLCQRALLVAAGWLGLVKNRPRAITEGPSCRASYLLPPTTTWCSLEWRMGGDCLAARPGVAPALLKCFCILQAAAPTLVLLQAVGRSGIGAFTSGRSRIGAFTSGRSRIGAFTRPRPSTRKCSRIWCISHFSCCRLRLAPRCLVSIPKTSY
jgi:hypothetical protein